MKEIQVGEYIRTINGYIAKIKSCAFHTAISDVFNLDADFRDSDDDLSCQIDSRSIKKHSFDIKELIEAGDLIKYRLNEISREFIDIVKTTKLGTGKNILFVNFYSLEQLEIISIVTKEQLKALEYEVK